MPTRPTTFILFISLFAIAACDRELQDIDNVTFNAASEIEGKADKAAHLCLADASYVFPEHSGNCVAVARYLKEFPSFAKCHGETERLPKCKSMFEGYHRILDMHWRAIAISLARAHNAAGYEFYRDEKAMSGELARCMQSRKASDLNCVAEGEDIWPKTASHHSTPVAPAPSRG